MVVIITEYAMVVSVTAMKAGQVPPATYLYARTSAAIKATAPTLENACVCLDLRERTVKNGM